MYYYYKYQSPFCEEKIGYVRINNSNSLIWFNDEVENFEYNEYLKWVEDGNEPEQWNPDNIDNGTE